MIIDLDAERGRISLSTKQLEPEPGAMVKNRDLVYEKAEEMAAKFREKMLAQKQAKAAIEIPVEVPAATDELDDIPDDIPSATEEIDDIPPAMEEIAAEIPAATEEKVAEIPEEEIPSATED